MNWKTLSYFAAVAALVVAFVGTANAKDYGTFTEDVSVTFGEIAEASTIVINSGVTVTSSAAITGSGSLSISGGGTLALQAESPNYSGAVMADNSQLLISVTNALGTGKVTLTGTTGSSLTFNGDNAIYFPNEVEISNSTLTTCISNICKKCVTFDGAISKSGSLTIVYDQSIDKSTFSDNTYMRFLKPVTVPTNKPLQVKAQGAVEFHDKVTAGTLYSYGGGSSPHVYASIVHLYSSENDINSMKVRWKSQFVANGSNAWGDAYVTEETGDGKSSKFNLGEYDQKVKYFNLAVAGDATSFSQIEAASTGATLTLDGDGSHSVARTKLTGKLNLVVNGSADTFVQAIKGCVSTTTGAIEVKRGKLQLSDYIYSYTNKKVTTWYTNRLSMASVPEIKLTGGNLTYSGTNENVFAAVTNLDISSGTFTFDGESSTLFGTAEATKAVAKFSGEGTMNIAADQTVYVYQAMTNGVWIDAGTYTGEGGATGTVIPQLTGTGALVVRDGTRTFEITESGDIDIMGLMAGSETAACVLNIASDVVVTNTTALSGNHPLTVRGGGRLALKVASPNYNSAIYVGLGQLWVQAEGALGSGDVTIQGKNSAGGVSRVVFDLGSSSATFDNNFVIKSSASNTSYAQIGFNHPVNEKQITFNGSFTAAGDLYMTDVAAAYSSSESSERICFKGAMTVKDEMLIRMRCATGFYGHLKLDHFYCYSSAGDNNPQKNSAYIYSTTNEIGYLMNRKTTKLYCCTNDICKDAYFVYGESSTDGGLIMRGYDQRLKYLRSSSDPGCVSSDSAATLTLYGGDAAVSATAYRVALKGAVSLMIDQAGDAAYSQTFSNATHTMTGSITVKKGTLNFTGSSTLAKVPEVSVTGGTLNMQSTANQAFKAVTTLSLSGGSLAVSETSTNLFGTEDATKAVAEFSGAGTMNIAAGQTVYVYQAMTNGVWLNAGTYTGEAGVEGAVVIPQLTGSGVLSVQSSGKAGTVLFIR